MSGSTRRRAPGALLVYNRPTLGQFADASNVDENIAAFARHSRFRVWAANTDTGFPPGLDRYDFDALVVHYSVFLPKLEHYLLGERFVDYIAAADGYKVAFFQDEHHHCGKRFRFVDDCGIDCVYTLLEQPHADEIYRGRTNASRVIPHLPSYVGDELVKGARRFRKRDARRSIDVGYRGRPSPTYWGRGAQEKYEIGLRFAELAAGSGLALDIDVTEEGRLYGAAWHRFMADCRATLGAESGVSCFDLDDEVRPEYERLMAERESEPPISELERGALGRWEGKIPYRTITPRNFEAAAFGVTQILFEGRYSGLMEPMRHYIPLRKDFSDLDEAIARFNDRELRQELTESAHRDLIASGDCGYERLVSGLDQTLEEAGLSPERSRRESREVNRAVAGSLRERWRRFHDTGMERLYLEHRRWFRLIWVLEAPFRIGRRLVLGERR